MSKIQHNQKGFSAVEGFLVLMMVAIIGSVGWYVFHAKQTADKNLGTTGTSSKVSSGGTKTAAQASNANTDNQSLQDDLNGVNSANAQTTKDLNTSNNGLNDNSTFTSVP